jgi:hypothetical protein
MTEAEKAARYWGKLADAYDESQLLAGSTYPPASHSFKLSTFSQLIADTGFDVVEAALVTREPLPTAYISAVKNSRILQ